MAANSDDKFMYVGNPGTATTLSAPGFTSGGTSMTVGSTTNWPTLTGVTFAVDEVTLVGTEYVRTAGTYNVYRGTVAGATSITNVVWQKGDGDRDYSAGANTRVYIIISSEWAEQLVSGLLTDHENPLGNHKTLTDANGNEWIKQTATASAVNEFTIANAATLTNPILSVTGDDTNIGMTLTPKGTGQVKISGGNGFDSWVYSALPAVSSVTENGNRSADITFASTVANILTPGMRIRTSRTVAAPTYMGGAFNGTNHYFTKVTPTSTLSTVTNNFTIMGHIEPTAYTGSTPIGRLDAGVNNGLELSLDSSGRVSLTVFNGGVGNYRQLTTYQSLPLNKKTHVAASWTSGTVFIYFDGISVPVAAPVTAGTAPTTAGTGGDFSIGRRGASNTFYYTGYISGCGVFDAVLSASTIRSYKNQVLSGSETNCIGAWSLNNTAVNQQAAGTNDLTATNSVSYTVRSPYTTDANGTPGGTYDWAIVTKVATTVATVQYPEGCAIPTSGGISTVDYSGVKAPFGMPTDEDRYTLYTLIKTDLNSGASPAGYVNLSVQLSIPVGKFLVLKEGTISATRGVAGALGINSYLTTNSSSPVASEHEWTTFSYDSSATDLYVPETRIGNVNTTAATTYYWILYPENLATYTNIGIRGNRGCALIAAKLAYL